MAKTSTGIFLGLAVVLGACGSSGGSGADAGSLDSEAGCPTAEPAVGTPCSSSGTCVYGASICCGGGFECTGGTWQRAYAACACAAPAPDAGEDAAASANRDSGDDGDSSASDARPSPADAVGGSCATASDCAPGQVCVQFDCPFGGYSQCANNPCGSSPLACSCAMPVCGAHSCTYASDAGRVDCFLCGG